MAVRLPALHTGRALLPQKHYFSASGTHFCHRLSKPKGLVRSEGWVKKTPWSESENEVYRPSDRRLSAKLVPTFAVRGCHVVSLTDPYCSILGFLDLEPVLFYQIAPQLYSRGWVDPVPNPLLLRKSGSTGNRTRTSGSVAKNSDHQTTEAEPTHLIPPQNQVAFQLLNSVHRWLPRRQDIILPELCTVRRYLKHLHYLQYEVVWEHLIVLILFFLDVTMETWSVPIYVARP
jgi:hypothetical protein